MDSVDMTPVLGTLEEQLTVASNAAIRYMQERDEAREAAREMFDDVVQYDPCDHCPGWKKQWPWITGKK